MIKRIVLFISIISLIGDSSLSQGLNHQFLLGYLNSLIDTNVTTNKARILFDTNNSTLIGESRKQSFRGAQGNISDANGNIIISSNGCWIANVLNDTMLNGSGLNPSSVTTDWCDQYSGIPFSHSNVVLPFPNDSLKFILLHQTGDYFLRNGMSPSVFYSIIDMNLDSGRGEVIQKNLILFSDTLIPAFAACKHANGRDWWIVALKDSSDIIFTIRLTPTGIDTVFSQTLNVPFAFTNVNQPTFSPDGKKFAYTFTDNITSSVIYQDVRLFDFDRCTGLFSNPHVFDISGGYGGLGVAFSPNSQLLYSSSFDVIYQINANALTVDTVAVNDGFYSPYFPYQTNFWTMYLAANGKIYISSGSGVIDMHYIDSPNSVGVSCNVMQHALHLPCYYVRGNVYHPNYYLGCDTASGCPCLISNINNPKDYDFKFSLSPNPSNGQIKIIYILPQNRGGTFQVLDITGKQVFKTNLPQWSTLQNFNVENLNNGIYLCKITSDNFTVTKKLIVHKE